MSFTTVIGLEIHVELDTETKIFCGCKNSFGEEENTLCCPVCAALPGALPVLNRQAVTLTIASGLSLGCSISKETRWDRKNYFYPDLPKAYQISQLYAPLCLGGGLPVNGRFIRLNRIHLEEDAGKLIHKGARSFIDLNRAGVPLMEIVTEPDLRSSAEAVEFVENVRRTLVYAGATDGRMERGSLRCDANVSVMPSGSEVFGTRTEIKNLNSFKFIKAAIDFEVERQIALIQSGGAVKQETRRYDADIGETFSMRGKEDSHDYRYFPDPDILPLVIDAKEEERIKASLSEPPLSRFKRYTDDFGLSAVDAETILDKKYVSDLFDRTVALDIPPKAAANVIKSEILRCLNQDARRESLPLAAEDLARLITLSDTGRISQKGLKEAVTYLFENGGTADGAVEKLNLTVSEDAGLVKAVIAEVAAANPKAIEQYRAGDSKVISFFMGQCAKRLKGAALPQTIQKLLKEHLEGLE